MSLVSSVSVVNKIADHISSYHSYMLTNPFTNKKGGGATFSRTQTSFKLKIKLKRIRNRKLGASGMKGFLCKNI